MNVIINKQEFNKTEFTNAERVAFEYWTKRENYKSLESRITLTSVKLEQLEKKLHPRARRIAEEVNALKAKLSSLKGKKLEDAEIKIWELEQNALEFEDNVTDVIAEKLDLEQEAMFLQAELTQELAKFIWFLKFDFDFDSATKSLFRTNNVITYEETAELNEWLNDLTASDYAEVLSVITLGKHLVVIQKAIQKLMSLMQMTQPSVVLKTDATSSLSRQEQQESPQVSTGQTPLLTP